MNGASRRPHRLGLGDAIAAEWIRFRSVRAPRRLVAVLLLGFPALALLVALTESLQPDDTILGATVLAGAVVGEVLAGALGAHAVTSELRSGAIHATLLACPRRHTVLAAKAVVVGTVVAVAALGGSLAAFGIGLAVLDTATYRPGAPFPAVLGVALAMAAVAVVGLAVGAVVGHPAGSVAAIVAVVLLPGLVAPLLGDARRWLAGASLDGVLQKLLQSSDASPDTVGRLGAWPSVVLVLAAATLALLGARWSLRRRDL